MGTTFMTWLGFVAMMVIAVCFTWRPAYATLRPPRHRPVAFLFGSLVFLLMAFMFAWLPANAIDTGHIHVSHRRAGTLDAWREIEPISFWLIIVAEYLCGLLIASYAIAGIALMDR